MKTAWRVESQLGVEHCCPWIIAAARLWSTALRPISRMYQETSHGNISMRQDPKEEIIHNEKQQFLF